MLSIENKEKFLDNSVKSLNIMLDRIKSLNTMEFKTIKNNKSALFIIDMNNGFAKSGLLFSERIKKLIKPISIITREFAKNKKPIIAYVDKHNKNSIELKSYPNHCMENTEEWKLVDEINNIGHINIIEKNCTNGLLTSDIQKFLYEFKDIDDFIVVGDCTDICLYQFVITLKSYFNQYNELKNIIVPINFVDTFDTELHNADLMNIVFLNSMIDNGIDVVDLKL